MPDPFADTPFVSDTLICALYYAQSAQELHFAHVLNFHADVLNGGLNQALYNHRDDIEDVIESYAALSLKPLSILISIAGAVTQVGSNWQDVFNRDDSPLDEAYIGLTYNLPYACNDMRDDPEFPDDLIDFDWVHRMALKYARINRSNFSSIIAGYKLESGDPK